MVEYALLEFSNALSNIYVTYKKHMKKYIEDQKETIEEIQNTTLTSKSEICDD